MKTMLLDRTAWDLVLDAQGNWALASEPYALAQDAASAIKTFRGEPYYDKSLGVPYWQNILGKNPPAQLMKAAFVQAAMTVPGVVSATSFLALGQDRKLNGQVQITDDQGNTIAVGA